VTSWAKRPIPLGMGIILESDSDIIPLIMPLLFRLFHLFFKKRGGFFLEIDNRVASQYTSPNCHEPIYLLPEPIYLAGSAMRANLPHMTVPNFQFTSFGSVARPIYLLPEVPSQFTSAARRPSVVAGVLSEMLLSRIWSLSGCMLG
jgi:hypothetical protein